MQKLGLIAAFVALCALPVTSLAETLRIGSWNIQDLHHAENFNLRNFGGIESVKRQPSDFKLLMKYRDLFGRDGRAADIIALQEIGTKAALEKMFPADTFVTIMSPRWENDDAPAGEGDVYTAIAIRQDSGVKVVKEEHLPDLAVLHTDGRPTRAGTAALLEFDGQQFWFLSVHLKSSCATTKKISQSPPGDCGTHWKQVPILADWIKQRRAENVPFIIAGDFNRRFRQMNFEDDEWVALNGTELGEPVTKPLLVAHPLTTTRLCPTRKGKSSTQPIDWFMLDVNFNNRFVGGSYWERRFSKDDEIAAQHGKGLSDHCPISIDLQF